MSGCECGRDHEGMSAWELFHHLWTSCAGLPGYDKRAWQELEDKITQVASGEASFGPGRR